MLKEIIIVEPSTKDLSVILEIHNEAFKGNDVADLTSQLLKDNSAKPYLSLLAIKKNEAVGHILFTRASINGIKLDNKVYILAPLAVIPSNQNQGIGGELIREGLARLESWNVKLVFVLGHINYYPKFGFVNNAEELGYKAPFPIPKEVADAWMVQCFTKQTIKGQVVCADAMNKPEHWRE